MINSVFCHRGWRRIPAAEHVVADLVIILGRCFPAVFRRLTVGQGFCFENGPVSVYPGNGVCGRAGALPDRVQGRVGREIDGCSVRIKRCLVVCVGAPSKEDVSVTGVGVGCQDTVRALGDHLRLHGPLTAVGIEGDGNRILDPHIQRFTITEQVSVHRISCAGILFRSARTVHAVVELRGGQVGCAGGAAAALVFHGRRRTGGIGKTDLACPFAAYDIRFVGRSIQGALDIYDAVHIDFTVGSDQRIRSPVIVLHVHRAGVVCFIINIDCFPACDIHGHARVDGKLRAFQQEHIRVEIHRTGHCLNAESARQRKARRL